MYIEISFLYQENKKKTKSNLPREFSPFSLFIIYSAKGKKFTKDTFFLLSNFYSIKKNVILLLDVMLKGKKIKGK